MGEISHEEMVEAAEDVARMWGFRVEGDPSPLCPHCKEPVNADGTGSVILLLTDDGPECPNCDEVMDHLLLPSGDEKLSRQVKSRSSNEST